MASNFYIRVGAKVHGPVDTAKLKKLAAEGRITRDAELSYDGQTKWTKAGSVKGLFPSAELIVDEPSAAIRTVVRHQPPPAAVPVAPAPAQPTIVVMQAPAAPQQVIQQTTVVVNTGATGNTCAMIAAVFGLLALAFCWIPLVGLLTIPVALLAILLAGIGLLIALFRKGAGLIASVGGGLVAVAAIVVSLVSTSAAAKATVDAVDNAREAAAASQQP